MKIFILSFLFFSSLFGYEKINVVVSVAPQAYFVKQIAQDKANISIMVPDGRSPETYEPLPSQMKMIKDANIYFGVGMDFEKAWMDRFLNTNPQMEFLDWSEGLKLRKFIHSDSPDAKFDPHIWLSVSLAKYEAQQTYEALAKLDPDNQEFYENNLKIFINQINIINKKIQSMFANPNSQKTFIVYHPAFGYLADEYNLEEIALENHGKEPKTKEMIQIRKIIKDKNIKVIYIQPEFSKKQIKALARDLKLKILTLDPLAKDWGNNILYIAKMIATEGKTEE